MEVVGLQDAGVSVRAAEDGDTPRENAVTKALTYFRATGLPTFSIDAGLFDPVAWTAN